MSNQITTPHGIIKWSLDDTNNSVEFVVGGLRNDGLMAHFHDTLKCYVNNETTKVDDDYYKIFINISKQAQFINIDKYWYGCTKYEMDKLVSNDILKQYAVENGDDFDPNVPVDDIDVMGYVWDDDGPFISICETTKLHRKYVRRMFTTSRFEYNEYVGDQNDKYAQAVEKIITTRLNESPTNIDDMIKILNDYTNDNFIWKYVDTCAVMSYFVPQFNNSHSDIVGKIKNNHFKISNDQYKIIIQTCENDKSLLELQWVLLNRVSPNYYMNIQLLQHWIWIHYCIKNNSIKLLGDNIFTEIVNIN